MKNLKNFVLPAIALLVLVGSLVMSGSFRSQAASSEKDVIVVNSSADPVLVRDIDVRARQPFQEGFTLDVPNSLFAAEAPFTVPTGKRLVVEYVSARGFVGSGQRLRFSIRTFLTGATEIHYLVAEQQGTEFPLFGDLIDIFVTSEQTRLYADAGTSFVRADRTGPAAGPAEASFTISGYLVDVP